MKTIFLDIQGCLTVGDSRQLSRRDVFEDALRASGVMDSVEIVISSDWRNTMNLSQLRALFSVDVSARIVGTTNYAEYWNRGLEVLEYVEDHKIEDWVAIDDLDDHFKDAEIFNRLIWCDRNEGFTLKQGAEIIEFLNGHGRWRGE